MAPQRPPAPLHSPPANMEQDVRRAVRQQLESGGELTRLRRRLRDALERSGWRADVRRLCRARLAQEQRRQRRRRRSQPQQQRSCETRQDERCLDEGDNADDDDDDDAVDITAAALCEDVAPEAQRLVPERVQLDIMREIQRVLRHRYRRGAAAATEEEEEAGEYEADERFGGGEPRP